MRRTGVRPHRASHPTHPKGQNRGGARGARGHSLWEGVSSLHLQFPTSSHILRFTMVTNESINFTWIQPNSKQGVRWQGFLTTALRDDKSKRQEAKCTYCKEEWLNGKPHKLFAHVKDSCKKMPPQQKSHYLQQVVDTRDTQASDSSPEDQSQTQSQSQTSKQSIDNSPGVTWSADDLFK